MARPKSQVAEGVGGEGWGGVGGGGGHTHTQTVLHQYFLRVPSRTRAHELVEKLNHERKRVIQSRSVMI